MTKQELDILVWLADEQRPVSHVVALPAERACAWVRARGGVAQHIDAFARLREGINERQADKIEGVPNVVRWSA